MDGETAITRRGLLRAGVGATAAVAAASAAGTATAQTDFDGWLSGVGNYDGTVVDATGQDSVTVSVGAEGNGGPYAFDPPAVQVDPGTTVVWEWTGNQAHNVVDEAGTFESQLTSEAGFTFERSFDSAGVVKYYCQPHRGLGMKGVVVVGDVPASGGGSGSGGSGSGDGGSGSGGGGENGGGSGGGGGGGGGGGEGGGGEDTTGTQTALQTLVAMIGLGLLSPLVFLVLLRRRQRSQSDRRRKYGR